MPGQPPFVKNFSDPAGISKEQHFLFDGLRYNLGKKSLSLLTHKVELSILTISNLTKVVGIVFMKNLPQAESNRGETNDS
jgi:hypothetical protein